MPTIDEEAAHLFGTKKVADPPGMWVIYDHPPDFPQGFIARQFFLKPGVPRYQLPTDKTLTGDTIEAVRAQLLQSRSITNIGRHQDETDPLVVETWI